MPQRQPFTALCQFTARSPYAGRADLHIHTTFSDGTYTPPQVVDMARRCGLSAIAVTDHDTLSGVAVARAVAPPSLEVIAGVEITTEYRRRELHLLAYFVRLDCPALTAALARIRRHRIDRFHEMVRRLRACGVDLNSDDLAGVNGPETLGRRNLAEMLVQAGKVGSVREAFALYLKDGGRAEAPKVRLPVTEALALVREAGGVSAWAHPSGDCTFQTLATLRDCGLNAIEVEYPELRRGRTLELRRWATDLGLAVSGGSDCHGPGKREIGCCTISDQELTRLRPA
jgi:predicted metal-dependent phosphoesterase TrpH